MECKKWVMEKDINSNDFINIVIKNGFVIIGVIGEFIVEDFLLFFKGNVGFLKKNWLKIYIVICICVIIK